ncbi:hypothetical protein BJ138DRAFT_653247 [Hygrophoropsis aurantiaca]|uniref:Uncharacterized protein n=1 Tax=Hygrophoropsis aurantiaca TaxID=72124 RepID=A0ACB7ZZW5_9AGAM|nr:hypothetical protein BJ138DRAFT_653247 [Hygrophoropsis aurantiaca]
MRCTLTDTANHYKICAVDNAIVLGLPTYVIFTTANPEQLPPPSTEFIFHIHFARAARFSGAGEYINTVVSDLEEPEVLSSSAFKLYHHHVVYCRYSSGSTLMLRISPPTRVILTACLACHFPMPALAAVAPSADNRQHPTCIRIYNKRHVHS